jgi:hypothetical protein
MACAAADETAAGRAAGALPIVGVGTAGAAAVTEGVKTFTYPKPSREKTIRIVTPHEIPLNKRGDPEL